MQKWGRIDLRFTKRTASVTTAQKWRMMSKSVTALSTSQTLDLGCFGNCLPIIFRPLASKNIVTSFLVENSEKVQADETCGEKNGGLKDSETDEKKTRKDGGDRVTFRDPEFGKRSYRPVAWRFPLLQNQIIQINGNFGTKFCFVLCAVHVTYLALFPSQCRGQVLVNL